MKEENKMLLGCGFKLFILGYKVDFAKYRLKKMVERRQKKNKPLCDIRLLKAKKKYEVYYDLWCKYEKEFLELKELHNENGEF